MNIQESFEKMLTGGHPNSLGRTLEVIEIIQADPAKLEELYQCYFSEDAVVRLRVSNAFKRICREQPEWLVPFIQQFIETISGIDQASTQWTLAELFLRLDAYMTQEQHTAAEDNLRRNLEYHHDWIVLNMTMQTLGEWAKEDDVLKTWLIPHLHRLSGDRRKSVVKRAKMTLKMLG